MPIGRGNTIPSIKILLVPTNFRKYVMGGPEELIISAVNTPPASRAGVAVESPGGIYIRVNEFPFDGV